MNTFEKLKEEWLKTREKGKIRFLLNGIFLYGGLGTVIFILFEYVFEFFYETNPNYQNISDNLLRKITISLIILSLFGVIINGLEWNKNEKEYIQNPQEK